MLHFFELADGRLSRQREPVLGERTVWIDLVEPTAEEDAMVERALGVEVLTRDEAREIEASSRLYRENGVPYMTAYVVYNADSEVPDGATVTFILAAKRLVTLRYHDPKAFPIYAARAGRGEVDCATAPQILVGILETIIDRAADRIERSQDEIEKIARNVFGTKPGSRKYTQRLDVVLRSIGRQGDITARLEESAFSLERLLAFLATYLREQGVTPEILARIEVAQRDVRSLADQMRFLMDRTTFLLDATLGAISIEQNKSMKIFSVLAATLMPPTLVAAIYGMNFKHMPELDWLYGYPMALLIMILAGLVPYLIFRWRGWI
ncbi:MAG: magnesium transporter CorA family protein [Hyphomicrobiaceae bacterium]